MEITRTEQRSQGLGSLQELASRNSIVLLLVDGNISEGALDAIEECSSWWIGSCSHFEMLWWCYQGLMMGAIMARSWRMGRRGCCSGVQQPSV